MTRTATMSYDEQYRMKQYYVATGQIIQQSSSMQQSLFKTISRADIVKSPTPRPKPLKPLAYSCSLEERKEISGFLKYATGYNADGSVNSVREVSGCRPGVALSIPNVAIDTALRALCERKVLLRIKDQKVNVPLAYAEANQTARLVSDTANRIARGISDTLRGKYADAARELGIMPRRRNAKKRPPRWVAHKRWLEMQYGWKPLLHDVYGAMEELAEKTNRDPNRFCRRVSAQVKSETRTERIIGSGPTAYSVTDIKLNICRIILLVKQVNLTLANAAQQGWSNPMELAWERVPFSFVAAWFVPIGGWLSSLDATLGYELHFGCRSEIAECKTVEPRWVGGSTFLYGTMRHGSGGRKYVFQRTPLNSFPTSTLPRLKNPVSMSHVTSALALLWGAFTS